MHGVNENNSKLCNSVWCRKRVALASIWMQAKQSTCVSIRKISTIHCGSQNLRGKLTFLGSCVSSTENDVNAWLVNAWTRRDSLSHWGLLSVLRKRLVENCTTMLPAILNKFLKQRPTKQELYGHLPAIS